MPRRAHPELQRALHPLDAPPSGPGWNLDELDGLVANRTRPIEAAVLVALLPRASGTQLLLTRRTEALRHHAGQVSLPGGRIEPGDASPLAAAMREADEEIGLAAAQVEPIGYLDPLATITGYRVLPAVAWVSADFVPRPDPGEVAEVFEVPLSFLLARENLLQFEIEFAGRARQVLEFRARDEAAPGQRIWGATASILSNLRDRLEAVR